MSNFFAEPCFLYILKCCDGSYYVGHSSNLEHRLKSHMAGQESGYTAARLPVSLVYAKEFETRDEAFQVERQVKGWSKKKKEALINNKIDELKILSSRAKIL